MPHLVTSVFFGIGSHRCNEDDVHESYVRLIPPDTSDDLRYIMFEINTTL